MKNLIVEGAASALSLALMPLLGECESFAEFEERALELSRRTAAEAMSRALEDFDRELASSRHTGSTVHSRRPRTLATMTGDVRFSRTVLLDAAGSTSYPLDEALGLPMGDRASPSMRESLVTCGADVPFERTSRLAAMGGGSSMGTMEAEQQHTYKVRMASFPCAWSLAGADAMARTRSWIASGRDAPPQDARGVALAEEEEGQGREARPHG